MANKKNWLGIILVAVVAGGVFAAPNMSKYQYFYLDKSKSDTYASLDSQYETDIVERFETFGLKFLSEKQLKSLPENDAETVLLLRCQTAPTSFAINLIDYSSERPLATCNGKINAFLMSMPNVQQKKMVTDALDKAQKLFKKR